MILGPGPGLDGQVLVNIPAYSDAVSKSPQRLSYPCPSLRLFISLFPGLPQMLSIRSVTVMNAADTRV